MHNFEIKIELIGLWNGNGQTENQKLYYGSNRKRLLDVYIYGYCLANICLFASWYRVNFLSLVFSRCVGLFPAIVGGIASNEWLGTILQRQRERGGSKWEAESIWLNEGLYFI